MRATRTSRRSGGDKSTPSAKDISDRLDRQLQQKLHELWKRHDAKSKAEFCGILVDLAKAKAETQLTTPKNTALYWLKKLSSAVTKSAHTPREVCECLWSDRTPRGEKVFASHSQHRFLFDGYGRAIVGNGAWLAGLCAQLYIISRLPQFVDMSKIDKSIPKSVGIIALSELAGSLVEAGTGKVGTSAINLFAKYADNGSDVLQLVKERARAERSRTKRAPRK